MPLFAPTAACLLPPLPSLHGRSQQTRVMKTHTAWRELLPFQASSQSQGTSQDRTPTTTKPVLQIMPRAAP